MINVLSILFSILGVGFVVIRAAALDRTLPWFKPLPPTELAAKTAPRAMRRNYAKYRR